MKAIEHEIEVNVRVHEVRSECERQKEAYVPFLIFKIHISWCRVWLNLSKIFKFEAIC